MYDEDIRISCANLGHLVMTTAKIPFASHAARTFMERKPLLLIEFGRAFHSGTRGDSRRWRRSFLDNSAIRTIVFERPIHFSSRECDEIEGATERWPVPTGGPCRPMAHADRWPVPSDGRSTPCRIEGRNGRSKGSMKFFSVSGHGSIDRGREWVRQINSFHVNRNCSYLLT